MAFIHAVNTFKLYFCSLQTKIEFHFEFVVNG